MPGFRTWFSGFSKLLGPGPLQRGHYSPISHFIHMGHYQQNASCRCPVRMNEKWVSAHEEKLTLMTGATSTLKGHRKANKGTLTPTHARTRAHEHRHTHTHIRTDLHTHTQRHTVSRTERDTDVHAFPHSRSQHLSEMLCYSDIVACLLAIVLSVVVFASSASRYSSSFLYK